MAPYLLAKGRYQEAYGRAKEALQLRDKLLAENDLETLASAHILAKAARSLEKLQEAHELSQRAMDGRSQILGEIHPNTLASADQLARYLQLKAITKTPKNSSCMHLKGYARHWEMRTG
jgi:tetratricopeptide (TPR) repeat protein